MRAVYRVLQSVTNKLGGIEVLLPEETAVFCISETRIELHETGYMVPGL